MLAKLENLTTWAVFSCLCANAAVAPWFFGAWEMLYFWVFVTLMAAGTLCLAARIAIRAFSNSGTRDPLCHPGRIFTPILAALPFLCYGLIRSRQAEVSMDALRIYLLCLLPMVVMLQVFLGLDRTRLHLLYRVLLWSIGLMAAYALLNHALNHSEYVLWRRAYSLYTAENRASGCFFCPDHFSGVMEIGFAMALGLLLARFRHSRTKWFSGLLLYLCILGVVFSKSRGGGLSLLFVLGVAWLIGFVQWPRIVRWYLRGAALAGAILLLVAVMGLARSYTKRFTEALGGEQLKGRPVAHAMTIAAKTLQESCRGKMYAAALRAWNQNDTTRRYGIGPGMHQNVWPHFAPSPDGDREQGLWPTRLPHLEFHSYEVHCDWLQVLEEFGWVGLTLFLLAMTGTLTPLVIAFRHEAAASLARNGRGPGDPDHALTLGALLAIAALALHSFGDFNLQIPAIGWMLAAVIAIPIALAARPGPSTQDDKL
jgi:O-antigen ligase